MRRAFHHQPEREVVHSDSEGLHRGYIKGGGVMTSDGKRGYVIDLDEDHIYVLWCQTDDIHQHSKAMPTLRPAATPKWAGGPAIA